jgi:SAM-dependent methyltransferase
VDETERIRQAYAQRALEIAPDRYSPTVPGELFLRQARERAVLAMLRPMLPLAERSVLEIGCGYGQWLVDFESWGAARERLAGIELDPDRAERARMRLGGAADIRVGDARRLPWDDGSKDIVVQSLALSSMPDQGMRGAVAAEMARVLAPGGVILSYDFFVPSPKNSFVRPLRRRELSSLFPGFRVSARRITLAPPLARALAPRAWFLAEALEAIRVLDTHLLVRLERG